MCKVMEEIRNDTVEKTLLQMIKNLMETLKLTSDEAMKAIKIPDAEREKYRKML